MIDLKSRIGLVGLPSAYKQFKKEHQAPYILYEITSENFRGSDDNPRLIHEYLCTIDFYSVKRDGETVKAICDAFSEFPIEITEQIVSDDLILTTLNIQITEVDNNG